jgi:hypothetical protein
VTEHQREDEQQRIDDARERLEHIGDGQPRRQHRDVVRYGGIAESDADVGDVSRDTYGTPIGPAGTDGPTGDAER